VVVAAVVIWRLHQNIINQIHVDIIKKFNNKDNIEEIIENNEVVEIQDIEILNKTILIEWDFYSIVKHFHNTEHLHNDFENLNILKKIYGFTEFQGTCLVNNSKRIFCNSFTFAREYQSALIDLAFWRHADSHWWSLILFFRISIHFI
jgi:hypothetical protein